MTSAYQSVRAGLCPYMYVCCHNMTVMFRAEAVRQSGSDFEGGEVKRANHRVHAVLTPTSRGFRDALKKEGRWLNVPIVVL